MFDFSGGAVIVTICGMKLLRSAFSETGRQFPILVFTVLFFLFDRQEGFFLLDNESPMIDMSSPEKPMPNLLQYFVIYYFIMSVILTKVRKYWYIKII